MAAESPTLAELLEQARGGSREATSILFGRLYDELRQVAGRIAGRGFGTLSPTAVVHETWLKLQQPSGLRVEDRTHFLNLAARAMRQVIANHARDRSAKKRGGDRDRERLTIALEEEATSEQGVDLIDLHDALSSLESLDARQGDVAAMRIFAGLTSREIADVLGVSLRTVETDWRMAKTYLSRTLDPPEEPPISH